VEPAGGLIRSTWLPRFAAGFALEEGNMRKAESAVLHLALNLALVAALIAISIPVAAAQLFFAPKIFKAGTVTTGEGFPYSF